MSAPEAAELAGRFDALNRFVRLVRPHRDGPADGDAPALDAALASAGALSERASARLRLTGGYTVVALAGATGTGKSSLFNALARMELSAPGHLRPTTSEAHSCVWGSDDAEALLDWLRIERRFRRESLLDAQDEQPLHGLVLLDLPDMDSVATGHRLETDRLIGVVDLVIWVLDPQKYADQTVHDEYLSRLGALHDVTVVVFNQIDRLSPADATRCRADLARLVEADGLSGVPVIATSARTSDGVDELRTLLEKAVAGRHAAIARLEGELEAALDDLGPLVRTNGDGPRELGRDEVAGFADELGDAASFPAIAATIGQDHARRAALPGWPFPPRRDDVRAPDEPIGRQTIQPSAVRAALRRVAARASAGLPTEWVERVHAVAAAEQDRVVDALTHVRATARGRARPAVSWSVLRGLWWLGVATVLAGAAWWLWHVVDRAVAWPAVVPAVMLVGAALAVLVLAFGRPLAAVRTRRARAAADHRLHEAALGVAREAVAPIRVVLRDEADARAAYAAAQASLPGPLPDEL